MLSRLDLALARQVLASAPRWLYVVPAALLLLNSCVHALRLRVLLRAAGAPVPLPGIVGAMLKAAFIGTALPTGGSEVAKVGFLARLCGSSEAALAAILVARLLELIPWTLLLLWGLLWGLWGHDPLVAAAATFFALAFSSVLVASALLVRRGPGRVLLPMLPAPLRAAVHRLPARLPSSLHDFARRLRAASARLSGDPRALWQAGLLTVPFSLVNCLVAWVIMRAHGLPVSYPDVLAVIPAVDTLIALPITISGLGVREALMVGLLAPFGATHTTAVAVGLTRWVGELGRAAVGGVVLLLSGAGPRAAPPA